MLLCYVQLAARGIERGSRPFEIMPQPSHDWVEVARVHGWAAALDALRKLEQEQCGGARLVLGSKSQNTDQICYGYRCPFRSSHGCKWQARIKIPREADGHDHVSTGSVAHVPPEHRAMVHKDHLCIIEISANKSHSDHFAQQDQGPHTVWKAAVSQNPEMLDWTSRHIFEWLISHGVQGVDAHLATRCKKFNERTRQNFAQARVGSDVPLDTLGGIRTLAQTYAFEAVAEHPSFSCDTAYLCPGWFISDTDMCLMFTTFNLMLNIYRASRLRGEKGVVYALDHTYKVSQRACALQHGSFFCTPMLPEWVSVWNAVRWIKKGIPTCPST